MEPFSALLALCAGNSPVTGESVFPNVINEVMCNIANSYVPTIFRPSSLGYQAIYILRIID